MLPAVPTSTLRKCCKYCQTEQPLTSFEICRIYKGVAYRRLRCKNCKKTMANKRRRKLRLWLEELKKTLRCQRCGFSDYRALVFHHAESRKKDFNIGDTLSLGLSRAAIKREIEKCIVLCSNCHHIEHYNQWNEVGSSSPLAPTYIS